MDLILRVYCMSAFVFEKDAKTKDKRNQACMSLRKMLKVGKTNIPTQEET